MNYGIFRSQPIMTINDLAQIGSHNKRGKRLIKVITINKNLDNVMNDFEEKMKTTKNTLIDKDYVKVRKDTFESMQNVIKETKNVMEFQPKIEQLFNEVNTFSKSHQTLEKENNNLKVYLKTILEAIKRFFKKLLQIGNEPTKEVTTNEIKDYYNNQDFDMNDVIKISRGTTKQDELFDYVGASSYLKASKKSNEKEKGNYDLTL